MYSEESHLEAFGGVVGGKVASISLFGEFVLNFNRTLIYPRYLVEDYIQGYIEKVPDAITDRKKAEVNKLYEQYVDAVEQMAAAAPSQ